MKVWYTIGICLALGAAGLAEPALGQTEYFAVFMEGKKVGHAIQRRTVSADKVTTSEEVSITISRLDVPITVRMKETGIESLEGKPLGFESFQDLGMMAMKVAGTIEEQGKVNVKVMSMGSEQQSTMDWPEGAVMAEGLRLLQIQKGLKEDTEYTAKVFSPGMLQALDAQIRIGGTKNVDLLGRVVSLTEVTTTFNMAQAGSITSTGYVDQDFRTQKALMPVAGINVEMIACTKEFALGQNDVLELVSKMFLPSPQVIDNVGSAKSITYYLSPKADAGDLKIPSTDNQSVRGGPAGTVIVTVRPVEPAAGARFPYKGKDEAILEALKPTRFVQSDRKEIIELARRAVGTTKDAGEAVKKIEAFVANYVENKSLSVGYASAAEVAASRQGDCSEFAVLTAAMCRAVGIPAQVVVGIAYVQEWGGLMNGFGGHAWVQAYVGDKWVGLDAAFKSAGRGGYGPGHITLAAGNGDPEDFFNLLGTIGRFTIDKVIVNKGS
jgi:transglutaminase-like putative cysteine protease